MHRAHVTLLRVLVTLAECGPATELCLTHETGLHRNTVKRGLSALNVVKFVSREPLATNARHRKPWVYELTPTGRAIAEPLVAALKHFEDTVNA